MYKDTYRIGTPPNRIGNPPSPDAPDTPECAKHTGPYASARFRPRCGRGRSGLGVVSSVDVIHREGGVVFRFDTETSTGRPYRRTSTPTRELDLAV